MKSAYQTLLVLAALAMGAPAAQAATPAAGPTKPTITPQGSTLSGVVAVQRMGKPKADASGILVYVVGFDQPPPTTTAATRPKLGQRNKQFERRLMAITAGQEVDFPNSDKFFHNVFSLSKTRKFDLGQFEKGRSKMKRFPRKGIVEVYCNIHPSMSATIVVLPNRAYAMTDKTGAFSIGGVPPGSWTVYAYSRHAARPTRVTKVVVAPGKTTVVTGLRLNEDRIALTHKNKYGQVYKDPKGRY